ncbi:MAG TPA: ABC transporter permease [Thermomicrobiales bacterium]|nr:ABC transporter permease [Thermomicrobiales bacterium]
MAAKSLDLTHATGKKALLSATPAWLRSQLRFWGRNRLALIGLLIILIVILAAVFAPLLAPHDPYARDIRNRIAAPGSTYLLGTDELGRDTLSRIIYGSRISLLVGGVSVGLATLIGAPLGLVAGYNQGRFDSLIMRLMDALLSFPEIVLAIAILAILGPSAANAMIAIGIVYIPIFARTIRAPALAESHREYVEAARASGANSMRILFRHIAPNTLSILIIRITTSLSYAILAEASLSYLGLSASPPTPTWGRMLKDGQSFMQQAPWVAVFPGIAIALAVLGFNLLGDGLRDAFDPRTKK